MEKEFQLKELSGNQLRLSQSKNQKSYYSTLNCISKSYDREHVSLFKPIHTLPLCFNVLIKI